MKRLFDSIVPAGGRRTGLLPLFAVFTLLTSVCLMPAGAAFAEEGDGAMQPAGGPVLDALRADWDTVSGKLVSLGEAIPAEKYSWAPSDEVRSVGEVLVHVAGPNFALTGPLLGEDAPADNPLESLGENPTKEQILDVLNQSIDRVDEALAHVTADDLGKGYQAFGREMSGMRVITILITHAHEHLGQLIAYARSNGVVPPWSRPE